jgi:predicted DCC family thiol-disulfide oxidoreductase YuxK
MNNQYIIIFDGVCNLCNNAVNFIIKRDASNQFVFAPMQSPAAQALIAKYDAQNVGIDTFLLIKNGQCFYRSSAALEITKDLSGYWYLCLVFKLVPRPIRDFVYRLIAKNRYRLFGKRKQCMIPTDTLKDKFLW